MIFFTVSTLDRSLLDLSETFLVISVLLTSTSVTTDLVMTDPDHMTQALALITVADLTILMKEFNLMTY